MHSWLSLSVDDVRRDFSQIAELGLDHVRVFPLWPLLQPNRTLIRERALDDVRTVVDTAAEFGLDASVDVIQGHLSSFDFVPSWLATWHNRNMFTDPDAVAAQLALVSALGGRLADAGNFIGLTLGNEVNQFSGAPHPSPWPIGTPEAEAWLTALLGAAEAAAPGRLNVHAPYDAVWYLDGHPFTPTQASRIGDASVVHSWIFNGTAQKYGGRSVAADRHAEYLIELARAFAPGPHRPVWLQEVGAPSNCLEESDIPGFVEATLRSAARCQDLWGITWWCSHDVDRRLADFPDLEYSLGLIRSDGSVKPSGRRFSEVAAELRNGSATATRSTGIVIDVDDDELPVRRAALSPRGAVFQTWVDLCTDGVDPALVTSKDAADPAALAARGITSLVRPDPARATDEAYSSANTVVEP
ncbi:glycosyl hydrolase [Planctomonas sp. JC2975]|nr:glycosyl hydrolase [Planctomonas sp. JC2975]